MGSYDLFVHEKSQDFENLQLRGHGVTWVDGRFVAGYIEHVCITVRQGADHTIEWFDGFVATGANADRLASDRSIIRTLNKEH